MEKVFIKVADEIKEYKNVNACAKELMNAKSGVSKKTFIAMCKKQGFEIVKFENTESGATSTKTSGSSVDKIVAKVIELSKEIDSNKIKELQKRIAEIMENATSADEMAEIISINKTIKELRQPKTDKNAVIKKFIDLYDEYIVKIENEVK